VKQSVNPAIMVVAVIIVLGVVAVIGFKVFGPENRVNAEDYRKKISPNGMSTSAGPSTAQPAMPQGAPPGYGRPNPR
jgi:hypothetical protein